MTQEEIRAIAISVRSLVMDAVEQAGTGHPGMPMGLAELGALIFGEFLSYSPAAPAWPNRDRLILSAGHGSLLQYTLMYLSGFPISLTDIKQFRQIDSRCPGHPEHWLIPGIEMTTGPLGQGIASAVGFALGAELAASRFNTKREKIIDHFTYVIAGDGDMMEGVSAEASSLAGHLGLGKLIVFYDQNSSTIEGSTELSFTEDVGKRYEAYGWQVLKASAYDPEAIRKRVHLAQAEENRPSLICLRSVLGKGAAGKEGSAAIHGSPLGSETVFAARRSLGLTDNDEFFVHPAATRFFSTRQVDLAKSLEEWNQLFSSWSENNPGLRSQWDSSIANESLPDTVKTQLAQLFPDDHLGSIVAPRKASGEALAVLMTAIPEIVGGSADLSASNNVNIAGQTVFSADNRRGRLIYFGVREHAMAAVTNGLNLYGGLRGFCATYLVFSDYMRGALRLAALMKLPSVFILTHDSIYVGEDGPTHQPVEHIASLRAMPNMQVLRPGDAQETAIAWVLAMEYRDGPTALILARQGLPVYQKDDDNWQNTVRHGAYIVRFGGEEPELVIIATGSEVSLALTAADDSGHTIRVVSMLDRTRFGAQSLEFQRSIIPDGVPVIVAEAGVHQGWEGFVNSREQILSVSRFGIPGPGPKVAERLGLTGAELLRRIDVLV